MASLLRVDPPSELVFHGPFNVQTEKAIHLTNICQKDVCFKVKTTAPRRYCVRPNCAIIEVGCQQRIGVVLQPFEFDPNDRQKHKFMVQCMELTPEEKQEFSSNTEDLFREIEKTKPDRISDTKLKCTFIQQPSMVNGNATERASMGTAPNVINNSLPEMQRLEAEVSQLRQELSKNKEEYAKLSHTNAELQFQLTRSAEQALKGGGGDGSSSDTKNSSRSMTMTIVLILIALCLGAVLGIWVAPLAGLGHRGREL